MLLTLASSLLTDIPFPLSCVHLESNLPYEQEGHVVLHIEGQLHSQFHLYFPPAYGFSIT